MKLLIITQKVDKNDSILGFFHRWIEEFSKHAEKVTVICLEKGKVELPDNVEVLSLGKETGRSRLKYLWNFYSYIYKKRGEYGGVFVHMNQIYVILGAPLWKLWSKPVGLWYTHKKVSASLKLAVRLADMVFSVSRESFRYSTEKLNIVGHGIDTEAFHPALDAQKHASPVLLSVGRVAPVKNIHVIVEALHIVRQRGSAARLVVVGDAIYPADKEYFLKLKDMIADLGLEDSVTFLGKIPNTETPSLYRASDIFINLSDTGSVDKVVLEAMASGVKVLTSNEAFKPLLDPKYVTTTSSRAVADGVTRLLGEGPDPKLARYVSDHHNLRTLIPKLIGFYMKKAPGGIR